jgi:hypothetical protein
MKTYWEVEVELRALLTWPLDGCFPTDRRMGELHGRSGPRGEVKDPCLPPGIEPQSSNSYTVTILIKLPRILEMLIVIQFGDKVIPLHSGT